MSYLMINDTDVSHLVRGLRVGYETLVSEESGRNANGDTVLDIVNRKVKLYVSFRPMDSTEMATLLNSFKDYVVNVSYRDSKSNAIKVIQCYTGTPEPEYYCILNNRVMYNQMDLNFIEL